MAIENRELQEICDISGGATLSRLRPKSPNEPGVRAFGVVQIADLDQLVVSDNVEKEPLLEEKANSYLLQPGEVLVSLRSAKVRAAVVGQTGTGIIAGNNLAVLKLHENVDPHYLASLISSAVFNRRLESVIGGTAIPSLTLSNLREAEVPLPPQKQQAALGKLFLRLQEHLATLEELGELRTQYAESLLADVIQGDAQ